MPKLHSMRNPNTEAKIINRRIRVALILILLLWVLILWRYFHLQVIEHHKYQSQSQSNRVQFEPIPPNRGLILDVNGTVLADNRPEYVLSLVKENTVNETELLSRLSRLGVIDTHHIDTYHEKKNQYQPFDKIPLKTNLSDTEIAIIAAHKPRLTGVDIQAKLSRYYPYAELLSHTLGYVGRINANDMLRIQQDNYRGTDHTGKIGLERYYENVLHGTIGSRSVEVDVNGRVIRKLEEKPAIAGQQLKLFLDVKLQQIAQKALGNHRGAVIALDPKTGGVLTMVSQPNYNPNLFVRGISHVNYNALRDDIDTPLYNRALQAQYPPGSLLKPILVLAGFEESLITRKTTVKDPGWYRLPNDERFYRDWKRTGHGNRINYMEAIAQSCDVFFYDLSYRMGIKRIHQYYELFGLGKKTLIDTMPERAGINPHDQWKRGRTGLPWFPGDTLNASIGQGFVLSTPMQMAYATSIIANRGRRIAPQIVAQVGGIEVPPQRLDTLLLEKSSHWEYIINAMVNVVHGPTGTAKNLHTENSYRIAGKTGTAQVVGIAQGKTYDAQALKERHRDHAWFAGFAPAEAPEIVVVAFVENGGSGSATAGPIVKQVMDYWLIDRHKTNNENP